MNLSREKHGETEIHAHLAVNGWPFAEGWRSAV